MSSPDLNRRFFLRGKVSHSAQVASALIRPPWALSEHLFVDNCTRCGDCISACPEKILVKGDGGFPEVSFQQGECTFCAECVKVCESDVFDESLTPYPEKAWDLSVTIQANCLSINSVVCRACGDNCETQAIQFQLKVGGISEPLISEQNCTGCGACVSVCPVDAVVIKPKLSESIAA